MKSVIQRCNDAKVPVVAGGPLVTTDYKLFEGVDHFVLSEAETTLPMFLDDLAQGRPQYMYRSDKFPDFSLTPMPLWPFHYFCLIIGSGSDTAWLYVFQKFCLFFRSILAKLSADQKQ